jgi:hypothetical protein
VTPTRACDEAYCRSGNCCQYTLIIPAGESGFLTFTNCFGELETRTINQSLSITSIQICTQGGNIVIGGPVTYSISSPSCCTAPTRTPTRTPTPTATPCCFASGNFE